MTSDAILRLLLWAVVINVALLLLLMWRRGLRGQVGFALLLVADLLLAVGLLAADLQDHPLAVVAVGAFLFLAVVPVALRGVTAWAVRRGRWGLAMRLTGLRELLQPGAGVGRERQLLAFLRQIQSGDTGQILQRLQEQAGREPDAELRATLHEQLLTLLALERRWEEAEQWADAHVTPSMVASRPRLGSALIRVYGERGRLDVVVRTLYLVEGGPMAQEPESAEVLEHCRIMVLAFTGHAEVLERIFAGRPGSAMESKVQAFWLGVAWQGAGDLTKAREWLDRTEAQLGPEDTRAREAVAHRRAQLLSGAAPVTPADADQTRRLVAAIEERASQAPARPPLQPRALRQTPVTLMLVVANLLIYGLVEMLGPGADANRRLILAGASLAGAVDAGEYWRLASAMFLHAGIFHLALNSFMLWFLGRFAEQLLGSVRFFVVYFGAGLVGNLASHLWRDYPVSVGASSSIFGMLGAALVVLLLSRGRVPEAWRRSMVFVLFLVIGLSFLPGLDVKQIDNYAHLGGLVGGAGLAALLLVLGRRPYGRWLGPGLGLLFVGVLCYCVWGLATSDLEGLRWSRTTRAGMQVSHPVSWFTAPGNTPGQLVLFHLFDDDRIRLTRGAGRLEPPAAWQRAQLAELQKRAQRAGKGVTPLTARGLPAAALPAPWRAVQITERGPDGRMRVLVVAYGQPARARPGGGAWLAELVTEPTRQERLLAMLRRVLGGLRSR